MFYRKEKRRHSLLRKTIRRFFLLLLLVLIYILAGGIIPFIKQKEVSDEYKQKFEQTQFYGEGYGVDRAAIIETSKDALDRRIQLITSAKKSILFTTFSMKPDRACREICAALYDAAERGVKVEMLIDGLSGSWDMKYDPLFYALGTHKNVTMKYYNLFEIYKPWTFNGRLHDKLMVADDQLLILGGRNTSNYFLGDYNKKVLSYDREVFVYNTAEQAEQSVISQVQAYFYSLWESGDNEIVYDKVPKRKRKKTKEAVEELKVLAESLKSESPALWEAEKDYMKQTIPVNHIELVSNPIHIMGKEPWVWYTMQQLMMHAKEQVLIQTPYMVLNDTMYDAFTEIGKDLTEYDVLLNSAAVGDNICASSDYKFGRKKILDTGIDVYEFQGEHSMHNKSLVIDHRLSVIGSYNFDMRSAYLDTETMLVIDGEEFAVLLEANINKLKKQSLLVRKDESYKLDENVPVVEMKDEKRFVLSILPYILRPIRFLL